MIKKLFKYLFIIFIIVIFVSGCGVQKKVLTVDEFRSISEDRGYHFFDVSDRFLDDDKIVSASLAATSVWQVEFYVLDNKDHAIEMYDSNIHTFLGEKDSNSYEKKEKGLNYENYSLTTNKTYMYVCRVDNTIIYSRVPVEYRSNIIKFINKLKY